LSTGLNLAYRRRDKSHVLRVLLHVVKFLDVDTLINLAHSSKKFSKMREVKFILNSQFKALVIRVSLSLSK